MLEKNDEGANQAASFPPPIPPFPASHDHVEMSRTWRFAFRGNGSEYFKIWITNLFLTIITLTIYAPWAKVRRLRYFYGNTYLNQRHFDFTGVPTRILIGRLIALGLYVAFAALSQLSVEWNAAAFVLIMLFVPWLLRSSFRFKARNSKYENSRFYFSAKLGRTYWVFICCVLITVFSAGLLFPIALLWFKRYQVDHLYIGQLKFKLGAGIADFFLAILLPSIAFILIMGAAAGLVSFAVMNGIESGMIFVAAGFLYVLGIFFLGPLIQGFLFRATWSHVKIGASDLQTDVNPWRFAWIQMTNSIAIVLSLGLLYAWAAIRIYRYKIESISVIFYDDPAQLINMAQQDYQAIGEEIADVFDFDVSL